MARYLSFETQCSEELIEFLSRNEIGTPSSSMVYRQLDTPDKVRQIPDPVVVSIKKNNRIIGSCTFCRRKEQKGPFNYIRYFSFDKAFKVASLPTSKTSKNSGIRQETQSMFEPDGESLFEKDSAFYAYLDRNNQRSARLCSEFGFREIRTFSTLTFSRLRPNNYFNVSTIKKEERSEVLGLLRSTYSEHNFYTEENIDLGHYHIVRDSEGKIAAGIQAVPQHWNILEMPGVSGWIMLNVLGRLPLFKKLIARDFQFLAFENLVLPDGKEHLLGQLMESILAQHRMNIGIISMDMESPEYQNIKKLNRGLAGRLKKEVTASVIARTQNNGTDKISIFCTKPTFISTLDLT